MRSVLLGLSCLAAPVSSGTAGQEPFLVRDIAAGEPDWGASSLVRIDGAVQGRAMFWARPQNQIPGLSYVLWSTDGTPAGTNPLTDLYGGESGSSLVSTTLCSDPDRTFFWTPARDGDGELLWISDGTLPGTKLLQELPPGTFGGGSSEPVRSKGCEERRLDGKLFFWTVRQSPNGGLYELWTSDETFEGTTRLAELGYASSLGGIPDFVKVGDAILFAVQTDFFRLWRTDGTESGTYPFLSQLEGTRILRAKGFVRVGNRAFFVGFDPPSEPVPLAVTDGTESGTRVYPLLFPELGTGDVQMNAVPLADRLLIPAYSGGSLQLHAVDPSGPGSTTLTAIDEVHQFTRLSPKAVDGRGLFVATTPRSVPHYTRDLLISSDGTLGGTLQLSASCGIAEICDLRPVGELAGNIFFLRSSATGTSLWKTDGTEAGTAEIVPLICKAICGGRALGTSGGKFFFLAASMWVSDGTAEGTFELIAPEELDLSRVALDGLAVLGSNGLLFSAADEAGREPWISDGTPEGTMRVVDLGKVVEDSSPSRLVAAGGRVLFSADTPTYGRETWVSAGTAGSTALVADLTAGGGGSNPTPLAAAGDAWPVAVNDPDTPGGALALFATMGAPDSFEPTGFSAGFFPRSVPFGSFSLIHTGSEILRFTEAPPQVTSLTSVGVEVGFVAHLAAGQERAYFRDPLAEDGLTLRKTMGTVASTGPFCTAPPTFGVEVPERWIEELAGGVVFAATDGSSGKEPYFCTEGSAAVRLRDIAVGSSGSEPSGFVTLGAVSLFSATDSQSDRELWRTNGTPEGTEQLLEISASGSSAPQGFVQLGSQVIFSADDGVHGREPWVSGGTADSTRMLADIAPGPVSSRPGEFEIFGDVVVFSAESLATGRELWVTSGTAESTRILADIRSGPLSSRPEELTTAGDRVYFRATDHRGAELWALWPDLVFVDGFESGNSSAWETN